MIVENDTEKAVIPRAYTYEDLARKKYKTLPLKGGWKEHLGEIERAGSILIYGDSGHGKTTYALQLMRVMPGRKGIIQFHGGVWEPFATY